VRAEFWMLVHPGDSEPLSGLTNEIFKRIRPNQDQAALDSDRPRHHQQFGRWLVERKIDVLGHRIKTLIRFEPGFQSQQTQAIFKELKATQQQQDKVYETWQLAKQAVIATEALQTHNSDPAKVAGIRKELKTKQEEAEDEQIMSETLGRKMNSLWCDLFVSLKSFQERQTDEIHQQLRPITDLVNETIRTAFQEWHKQGAPLLKRLHEINQEVPGMIYYSHLNLTDLERRQLKSLAIYPVIKSVNGRYEFALEEVEK